MWRKLVRQIQAWYKNEAFYLYLAQGARCLCQLPNYVILFADVNEPKKKKKKMDKKLIKIKLKLMKFCNLALASTNGADK